MQFPLLNFTTRCCKVQEWRALSGQGRMNNTPERREPVVEDFGDMLQQSSVTDHYGDRATAPRPPIPVLPLSPTGARGMAQVPAPAEGAVRRAPSQGAHLHGGQRCRCTTPAHVLQPSRHGRASGAPQSSGVRACGML